jgi:hypothetical protein
MRADMIVEAGACVRTGLYFDCQFRGRLLILLLMDMRTRHAHTPCAHDRLLISSCPLEIMRHKPLPSFLLLLLPPPSSSFLLPPPSSSSSGFSPANGESRWRRGDSAGKD